MFISFALELTDPSRYYHCAYCTDFYPWGSGTPTIPPILATMLATPSQSSP